ncbi:MAG: EF-hand domain-containing protein, partial [Phycisphaerales bacterium]|nr:EF-hand domain-containing protein [Phycisphaerales bacterium]
MTLERNKSLRRMNRPSRRRGAAAILAMMFLVIFSSLAAAMAIVALGNLATADTQLKVSRALAAAETGMRFAMLRISTATAAVPAIREGQINATKAAELWTAIRTELVTEFLDDDDEQLDKADIIAGDGGELHLPPIALGRSAGAARFVIRIDPHPISGVNYDDAMFVQAPYAELGVNISNTTRLDARWLRVTVVGIDGPANHPIKRAAQMDFKIDKKIRFALLSKNRVMIGPHVLVDGPVGSRFMDTDLAHGHPVQMASDFRGLTSELDAQIDEFVTALVANDKDGDNRIRVEDTREVENIEDAASFDTNGDGYIDEFDFFLGAFDTNSDGRVSAVELETAGNQTRSELFELLDGHGSSDRVGYNDGFIDTDDNYAKVHGQLMIVQNQESWAEGAASASSIQNYLQGAIIAPHDQSPLTYQASAASVHQYTASDFNVDGYRAMAEEDLATQAAPQAAQHNAGDPDSPSALGEVVEHEAVP